MGDLVVTVSEIGQFLRCRRQWDIVAHKRRSLKKIGAPSLGMHLGTMVHVGLEAFARGEDYEDAIRTKAQKEFKKACQNYEKVVGAGMSGEEATQFHDVTKRATVLVSRYIAHYDGALAPKGYKVLPKGIELTFKIPLAIEGLGTVWVAGTMDLLLECEETSKIWILDHKTFKQRRGASDINFQFNSYMWAVERLLGPGTCGGFVYDGISTKDPTYPRLLKNGTLSRQWIDTTEHVYLGALQEYDLDPKDYKQFLLRLRQRDNSTEGLFYTRKMIPANRKGLQSQEQYLMQIARDMLTVDESGIYPNFRWQGCWDCSVQDLCQAMHYQEDTTFVIENNYYHSDAPYGTVERLKANPETISSVADLR